MVLVDGRENAGEGKAAVQSFFMAFRNGLGVGWTAPGQEQLEQIAPIVPACSHLSLSGRKYKNHYLKNKKLVKLSAGSLSEGRKCVS